MNERLTPRWRELIGAALILFVAARAEAQDSSLVHPAPSVVSTEDGETTSPAQDPGLDSVSQKSRKATPLIAPIPTHNPQLGWGLILMAGLIHRIGGDTVGPPSTAVVIGFASENGSWGVLGGELAHLHHDNWRAKAFGAYFSVKYDYFGIGSAGAGQSVGIHQTIAGGRLAVSRRVAKGIYLGMGLQGSENKVELQDPASPPADTTFLQQQASVVQVALVPTFELDTRNDNYFPTAGMSADAEAALFMTAVGSDSVYQKYKADINWYTGFRQGKSVVALGALGCYADGHAPFYTLCTIGGPSGLRGVETFRYLDRTMFTLQAEYRHMLGSPGLPGRFGFAVFGGVAGVGPSPGHISNDGVIAAGGAGIRFRMIKAYPLHMRLDVAGNKDGAVYYFGVGENF